MGWAGELPMGDFTPCFNGEIPGEFAMACHGEAWVMEIHPTLAIKSPGLGDPEAGWVPSKFCHGVGQFTGVFFSERNGKVIFWDDWGVWAWNALEFGIWRDFL